MKLCKALKVSRSGFYAWLNRKLSKRDVSNQKLARTLIALHEMYPAYGLDSLYHVVRKQIPCSRAVCTGFMKSYNIHSMRYKSSVKHRYVGHNLSVKDNLLAQNFSFEIPNTVWVGDITYLRTMEGWLYLAIVKDLCTKRIIGYAMSDKIDAELAISALDKAIRRFRPSGNLTFHSDRGSQYAARTYQEKLKLYRIKSSMSRSGNPYECEAYS